MSATLASAPAYAPETLRLAAAVARAAALVDRLYEAGHLEAAEDLDALVTEAEALLEDDGDFEEGVDLENDELSDVDEDGAHEFATALPEDEVQDDDLNFAYERGRYAPERRARFYDEEDDDLAFAFSLSEMA